MLRMFVVVSEQMESGGGRSEPPEPYHIAMMVACESRHQARLAAWKADKSSYCSDIREMPRFAVRQVAKDLDILPGDYSADSRFYELWDKAPIAPKRSPERVIA